MLKHFLFFSLFLSVLSSCSNNNEINEDALFSQLEFSQTGVHLLMRSKWRWNEYFHVQEFYNGGGVAIGILIMMGYQIFTSLLI
jgi:hypothetical protein